MTTGLNVVALVSGGKDSFFSILHCIANGHNVVALANLHPPQPPNGEAVEDLDSFMYQTVGHTVIPLYAEALGLPLYRQEIVGTAVNQHKSYGSINSRPGTSLDETESLVPLLQKVMQAQPSVNAVCTGAIMSDYQRTRVESVAIRLGLTPLSYLWQFPFLPPYSETSLLKDMLEVGQDSRIIKVASGGLDESFLWQNVAERGTIQRLSRAAARFGSSGDGAVLGEGGEFETLAVQGPWPEWKGRIVVDDEDRESVVGEAGTASLRIRSARVVPMSRPDKGSCTVRVPPLFDDRFQEILDTVLAGDHAGSTSSATVHNEDSVSLARSSQLQLITDVVGEGGDAAEQMKSIMEKVKMELARRQHEMSDVAYTSIILKDVADFPSINAVYGLYFTEPNPPARVTTACQSVLPPGKHLAVAVSSFKKAQGMVKKGLHVQSRSYWAPANIGPYSQAISTSTDAEQDGGCEVVYIAGQIPLDPATMEIARSPRPSFREQFAAEAVLALQHLFRIGARMNVKRFARAIAFVVVNDTAQTNTIRDLTQQTWSAAHAESITNDNEEESGDLDVWDLKNRLGKFSMPSSVSNDPSSGPQLGGRGGTPELTVIVVDALPRGAQIEWVSYGLTGERVVSPDIPHLDYLLDLFKNFSI